MELYRLLFFIGDDGVEINLTTGAEVTTWTANHDAAGFDLLNVGGIQINNPADTFQYIITPTAIIADRIVNLPLLTATGTFVITGFPDLVTDTEIGAHTSTKITINAKGQLNSAIVYNDQINTFGDFVQTFKDNALHLENPAGTFDVVFQTSAEITSDRILTIPLLGANRTMVVTGLSSQITIGTEVTGASTDLTNTADIVLETISNTYTANTIQTFTPDASNAGINVGSFAGEPTGANGEIVYDSTSNQMKGFVNGAWVDLGQSGSEVTTWTADHSAAGFDLNNLSLLVFQSSTDVAPAGTVRTIYYDDVQGMLFNALTGDFFQWEINAVNEMRLTATALDLQTNNLFMGDSTSIQWAGSGDRSIFNDGTGFSFEVETGDAFKWLIQNASEMTFDATNGLLLARRLNQDKGGDIASASALTLGTDGNTFDVTGSVTINTITPTNWQNGAVVHLQFDAAVTVTHNSGGTNDILLGDQSNMSAAIGDVLSLYFNGTDWVEISRSVVGGGGEVFTWTADHSAAGFDLNSLSNLVFQNTTAILGSADRGIYYNDAFTGMNFLALTGDRFTWRINDVIEMEIESNGDLDLQANALKWDTHGHSIFAFASTLQLITDAGGDSIDLQSGGVSRLKTDNIRTILTNRLETDKGADVASSGTLTLGTDGNVFDITGVVTINQIINTNWVAGAVIHLQFDGILTVTHDSGGLNDILLADDTNMTTAAGDVLSLYFDGTDWIEVSRSVISTGTLIDSIPCVLEVPQGTIAFPECLG